MARRLGAVPGVAAMVAASGFLATFVAGFAFTAEQVDPLHSIALITHHVFVETSGRAGPGPVSDFRREGALGHLESQSRSLVIAAQSLESFFL